MSADAVLSDTQRAVLRQEAEEQLRRSGLHLGEIPAGVSKWNRWARALLLFLGDEAPRYVAPTHEDVAELLERQGNQIASKRLTRLASQQHSTDSRVARQRAELDSLKRDFSEAFRSLVLVATSPNEDLADALSRAQATVERLYRGPSLESFRAKILAANARTGEGVTA